MSESIDSDIFRDSPLRLLGYANELAEAFRPVVHKYTVYSGYGVAISYMIADIADKAYRTYKVEKNAKKCKMSAIDAGLWQGLASLIVPSIIINRFSASSRYVMKKVTRLPDKKIKFVSVVLSIGLIPVIVKPIDAGVDSFMDHFIREKLGTSKDL